MTTLLLLVEDETLIALVLEDILTDAGFDVVVANDGAEATAILDRRASDFRALVTDIRIGGGIEGWDVAQRARQFVPGLAVVYITGDSAARWADKGVANSRILQKPFAATEIVTAVSQLINA